MVGGNTSDFIGHAPPKDSVSDPYHLNPALLRNMTE